MSQPTGKEKASRIPLDYHRRVDPLVRARLLLAAVASVLTAAFVAWGFLSPSGATQHSHGPVAAVHAKWENDCLKCHEPFAPIRNDAWAANWPVHDGARLKSWVHASDAKCQSCHAGPRHANREKSEEVASCSSCHQDHQGADVSLVRMDDQHCTRCHGELANHTIQSQSTGAESSQASLAQKVTSWISEHPEFRSLTRDPGTIKFTHFRHMSPGLRSATDDRVKLTLADLPSEDRERYRRAGQTDSDLVQLDCASCHQPGGDYMHPIAYVQHCQACHPLSIDPQTPSEVLPHGLTPDRIRRDLLGRLSQQLMADQPQPWKELLRPVPARQGERPPREPLDLLAQRVLQAERHLRRACDKCHEIQPGAAEPSGWNDLMAAVKPAHVPQVWLRHARFDHAAHRFLDCRQCHERAYADHAQASKSNHDVLIAGRAMCLTCHNLPAGGAGGARHDCAECHYYHAAQDGASLRTMKHFARRNVALPAADSQEAP